MAVSELLCHAENKWPSNTSSHPALQETHHSHPGLKADHVLVIKILKVEVERNYLFGFPLEPCPSRSLQYTLLLSKTGHIWRGDSCNLRLDLLHSLFFILTDIFRETQTSQSAFIFFSVTSVLFSHKNLSNVITSPSTSEDSRKIPLQCP